MGKILTLPLSFGSFTYICSYEKNEFFVLRIKCNFLSLLTRFFRRTLGLQLKLLAPHEGW